MQEAIGWARQPDFSAEMLASLRDLNHRFLDLMAARERDGLGTGKLTPAGELSARVAPLAAAQRAAAASCPYALFDLRLDDDAHWQSRLRSVDQWRIADETAVEGSEASFVRLALFYAWHVAATRKLAAQLLLGMTEATAAAFRGVTLNCLPALVASETANLSARWRASSFYWSALLVAAARTDPARLRKIQLFGVQLAASALLP
jgi:hypothetical protein